MQREPGFRLGQLKTSTQPAAVIQYASDARDSIMEILWGDKKASEAKKPDQIEACWLSQSSVRKNKMKPYNR